jgi:diguanylate cyclase (GGDEF)-like protein
VQAFHKHRQLNDEILQRDQQKAIVEMQERYDAERRTRDIALLNRENELKGEQLRQRDLQQRLWWLLAATFVLSLGVVAMLYRKVRRSNAALASTNQLLLVQSERDPLTGLANRRHFREALAARQEDEGDAFSGGLILLDVDHFKRVNDEHGHAVGDSVLVEVARRLSGCVRAADVACRWGGEEFLVHTPTLSAEAVEALALRVMGEIGNTPVKLAGGLEIPVTMSMAYASFPLPPNNVTLPWEQAVNLVDMALYSAKAMGRDRAVGIDGTDASTSEALARAAADFERSRQEGRISVKITRRNP